MHVGICVIEACYSMSGMPFFAEVGLSSWGQGKGCQGEGVKGGEGGQAVEAESKAQERGWVIL